MKNTVEIFKEKQEKSLSILQKIASFLNQGEELGIGSNSDLIGKLQVAINSIKDDKLKIALIGGFSEGKTSIVAAWLNKLDKSSMKISHQESSNEVKIYQIDDELTLIDTPGLFGFKEKQNPDTNQIEKYKDITKKFVSEAHLVIYVMNSTNPIKESHKDDLIWLFRDLDLLPRTVFVLSRFDEVADVADEAEYQDKLSIKTNNVIGRLTDLINLTETEKTNLAIVAVSANPFDMGLDYWLNKFDEFKQLSHISSLQTKTAEKINLYGGIELIEESKKTIIKDILNKQLPIAIENDKKIKIENEKLAVANRELDEQLKSTEKNIANAVQKLNSFVMEYFTGLIMQIEGKTMEDFSKFFEREIGNDAIIINNKIESEFRKHLNSINLEIEKVQLSFDNEINHYNSTITQLGKQGLNYLNSSKIINNTNILAVRNVIRDGAKTLGWDISKALNFAPHGAKYLARFLNNTVVGLGFAVEICDSWSEAKKVEEFNKKMQLMKADFEKQRSDLIELLKSADFENKFFPNFVALKVNHDEITEKIELGKQQQRKFQDWREFGESIEVEFKNSN